MIETNDVEKLIAELSKEIRELSDEENKETSLIRLQEIAKEYAGDDKVVTTAELVEEIKARPPQKKMHSGFQGLDDILDGFREKQLIVLAAPTKSGKCFKENTPILMIDGSTKLIQEIKVGDKLMGPDSRERTVTALGNGKSEMYEVTIGHESFTANGAHILPLRNQRGKYVEITIDEFLKKKPNFKKHYKGYFASCLNFNLNIKNRKISIDPYILGLWLGDGTSSEPSITNPDKEIISEVERYMKINGGTMTTREKRPLLCKNYYLKGINLKDKLRQIKILNNKHIPKEYLINNESSRLELLAGLIDTDGHLSNVDTYPYYEMVLKDTQLAQDFIFLARSLGFRVNVTDKKVTLDGWDKPRNYKRITIRGNLSRIPLKVQRKKSDFCPSRDYLACHLKIKPVGIGKYYGFELDGDGLFVLGNFVVTHNTSFAIDLTIRLKNENVLWFPFEEPAEELIQKFLDRNEEPPHFMTPRKMLGNTLVWIEKKIIEAKAKYDAKIVFIDHLHFIVPFSEERQDLRIGETMRNLKKLAVKWNMTIFLIAHLKKTRVDNAPDLEDLRDSSFIAQEADTVMMLWRETKRVNGFVEISNNVNLSIQANRRTGKTGNVKLVFENGRFYEKDWKHQSEDEKW